MTRTTLLCAVTGTALWLGGADALHAQRERDRDRDRDRSEVTFDTTLSVRGPVRFSIYNQSGEITIRGGGRNQIRIQAELDDDRTRVEINESASRVNVRTTSRRGRGDANYTITVPTGTQIEVGGISTDLDISQVCGELAVNTISGDITVACTEGPVMIQAVSGDVDVTDARGDVEINATSGDVRLRNVRGNASVHSVSGEVDLAEIQGSDVTAESVSGEILYVGPLRDNGRYRFVSHSGEVEVRALGTINATVSVSTFSGEFVPEFPVELQSGTRMGKEWQFRLGSGSARVRLESFSGTIYLRRGAGSGGRED